jgi:hypothetical protein
MSAETPRAHHPIVVFWSQLFRSVPHDTGARPLRQHDVTSAELSALPKQTQLLVAHFLERNNSSVNLLKSDKDVGSLLSDGWLMTVPSTIVGIVCFKFMPRLWKQLKSLRSTFLTQHLLSELEAYRKGKSAIYPWLW